MKAEEGIKDLFEWLELCKATPLSDRDKALARYAYFQGRADKAKEIS